MARSSARISIPTPVPNASSVRISMAGELIPPRVVVPTQDLIGGVVAGGQELDLGGDSPPQIRILAVLQPQPRGRAQSEDRIAPQAQASRAQVVPGTKRLHAPPLDDAANLLRRQSQAGQNSRMRRVDLERTGSAEDRDALVQSPAAEQVAARVAFVRSVVEIGGHPF